jgi:mono/diheme cytochrome c family protein
VGLTLITANVFHASAQPVDDDPVSEAWRGFPETFACQSCHANADPIAVTSFADPRQRLRGDFSRQDEMYRWVRDDKHAIARIRVEPLRPAEVQAEQRKLAAAFRFTDPIGPQKWVGQSNVLSRRICDAMGLDIDRPEGYQKFAESCLTCHGGYDPAAGPQPAFAKSADLKDLQPGISCLACHQESGGIINTGDAWVLNHASLTDQKKAWRLLPPEAKAAQGMRDLTAASNQADLCIDCHVGNISKGMFLSHAMYAAGHPPLPNFEMETFCRSMPRHWRSESEQLEAFQEANYPGKEAYFAVNFPEFSSRLAASGSSLADVPWDTRRSLVGAIAVRRRIAEMLVQAATSDDLWGDYSFYDCGACHHELRRPSLRQMRGFTGAPGRPRLHEWPDIILETVAPASSPAAAQKKLLQLVSAVPFGDQLACGKAANELLLAMNEPVKRIESEFGARRQHAWTLIERLSRVNQGEIVDYATGRQVMWSILVAVDELGRAKNLSAEDTVKLKAITAVTEAWRVPSTNQGRLVSTTSVGIATELPAGRGMFIFRENLYEELERRANYEPTALFKSLQRIHQAFPQSP